MTYNTSNITNASTPTETLTAIAKLSDAVPISLIIVFFAAPTILVYRRTRRADTALRIGGFTGTIIGMFQWAAGLISWGYAVIPLPFMLLGIGLAYWN